MTVLQLISSEGYYGAESMMLSLARALESLGCESRVAVFSHARLYNDELEKRAIQAGICVESIPCAGRWDGRAINRIRDLLTAYKADVLHTHGYKADIYGYAARRPRRSVLVATCHNWPNRRLSMRTYAAADRLVLRHFDRVATASRPVAQVLTRWRVRKHKLRVIPNGVDIARFHAVCSEPAKGPRTEAEKSIGFIGRLVPGKGGALLIRAAESVIEVFPNCTFFFVGEGPARVEWEGLAAALGIASRVVFTGKKEDMAAVYRSLDIVVLPSYQEAMPMCLLEALAAGKPVVATAVGAVPDLVVPGITGLLTDVGDANALSAGILRLLDDPQLAHTMAQRGQAHVAKHYAVEAVGRQYLDLYHEALSERCSRVGEPVWQQSV